MTIDQNKRVLVPVSNPLGGIRTYMLYTLHPIQKAGFRFTFLAPEGSVFDLFKEDLAGWDGVEFIDAKVANHKFSFWRSVRDAIRTNKFALIHSQGLRAGTETAIGNYFTKIPHLITLHDVIVPQNDIPGRFKWFKMKIGEYFSRHATIIVPVSHDCAENHLEKFPKWKKGPCRINVIPNGINVQKLLASRSAFENSDATRLRRELNINDQVLLGGFFGRFMPQKGFKYLLEALSELARRGYADRFRVIATQDNHGYKNETIRSVAERPEVAKMVHFVGQVADIAPLLSQMDVLVMPSLWEACPILPMEAMVLGIPVIGSDAVGLREVLRGTPSMTPPQGNAGALADAIAKFIDTPFTEQAKAFEAEAQRRFNVENAAQKLWNLYEEAIVKKK